MMLAKLGLLLASLVGLMARRRTCPPNNPTGAAIGMNSAILNIVTEWLSDIKLGHCSTAFYLNENFCCWGAESGCENWKRWSKFGAFNYVLYIAFAVCHCGLWLVPLLMDMARLCSLLRQQGWSRAWRLTLLGLAYLKSNASLRAS
jgi:hypothetical protein